MNSLIMQRYPFYFISTYSWKLFDGMNMNLWRDSKRSKNFHFHKLNFEIIFRIIKNISQRYLTKKKTHKKEADLEKEYEGS